MNKKELDKINSEIDDLHEEMEKTYKNPRSTQTHDEVIRQMLELIRNLCNEVCGNKWKDGFKKTLDRIKKELKK